MVLVTALAASFMAAASSVVASIARSRAQIRQAAAVAAPPSDYRDLLRWDLANARGMKLIGTRLVIVGYNAIDPRTGQPTQQPAEITYDTRSAGEHRWLLRQQRLIGARSGTVITLQPVAAEVVEFNVQVPADLRQEYERSKRRDKPGNDGQSKPAASPSLLKSATSMLDSGKPEEARPNPTISPDPVVITRDPLVAEPGWASIPPQLVVTLKRGGEEPFVEQTILYGRIRPAR
jgi:hypothetical protein